MLEKIRKALLELDPSNANQWTSEGLPRLDVMKDALGNAVSRAEITSAAKTFSRKNPVIEQEAEAAEEPVVESTPNLPVQAEQAENADSDVQGDEATEKELVDATAELHAAQARMRKANAAMDAVVTRRAEKDAGRTTAHDIKAYQKSQHAQRANLAKRAKFQADLLK